MPTSRASGGRPPSSPAIRKAAFKNMSEALVVRHLQESWPKPRTTNPTWFRDGEPFSRYHERISTIAVVGAGASFPMMSIADDLADKLEEEVESDKKEREVELERLENVYGLNPANFETRLTAICRTPEAERKVREKISEHYRHHYPTLLTYELLAHLLHHRFLDAIISFNFDELLDRSIEDEMGSAEYTRVVTERDCDPSDLISTPLYIKMHGTASEPDSLRFTRERYYETPKSIISLVEKQFDVEHLVLLNLGFTMASFDFQYLLRKPKQLEIYHLDPKPLLQEVKEGVTNQRRKHRQRQKGASADSYDAPDIYDFSLPSGKEPGVEFLENLMSEAVDAVEKCCSEPAAGPAAWRSTLRHKAVVAALKGSDTTEPRHRNLYLRRRAILELAFAAAKGRGVLSIAAMVNERCGRYYDLYASHAGDQADSWPKICRAGGLIESPEWPDTYEVLEEMRVRPSNSAVPSIHRFQLVDPRKLAAHVVQHMDVPSKDRTKLTKLLADTLDFLQGETEIEVHSRDDKVCSKIFSEPVILKTLTALQGWTRELLEGNSEYDELRVVAEAGGWLGSKEMLRHLKEKKPTVKLITAFEKDPNLPSAVEIKSLPWGRHNRHMTIVCSNGQPRAAIYFVRRLRAATITPVFLSKQEDLERVASAFDGLWAEAEIYERELEQEACQNGAGATISAGA
jgi:hypothetical protein